ncbi:MAG: polyamine aminopropyltransferase [Rhodospirillaceae bacterium]
MIDIPMGGLTPALPGDLDGGQAAWFCEHEFEKDNPSDWQPRYQISRIIHEAQTAYHRFLFFENPTFGRIFVLDGVVQNTERDGFAYQEMLAHPPLFAHPDPKRVLIIGCGAGGTLREVLRHPVEQATIIDIDGEVVEVCRTHMSMISAGAFEDPRTRLVIGDGFRFVKKATETYDVIIVDSPDPVGAGAILFTEEFFSNCRRCLAPGGILVTQSGVPFLQPEVTADVAQKLKGLFPHVSFYGVVVPTYGGLMALSWSRAEGGLGHPTLKALRRRYKAGGIDTRYYTPELHQAAFGLPAYVRWLTDGKALNARKAMRISPSAAGR